MSGAKKGPSIARLLLGVNAFVLLVPVLALVLLGIYDTHLIRVTERRLISESVLVGEAWRDRVLEATGRSPMQAGDTRPPGSADERFHPVEPVLSAADELLPPEPDAAVVAASRSGPAWAAGAAIKPLLDRAKLVNLSAVRVLDERGCVVASSGSQLGLCLGALSEVKAALGGRYTAVKRRRLSDEKAPPFASISRRGVVRVYSAMPVFSEGRVIGVVRISRTSVDPLEALWAHRGILLAALAACVALTGAVSWFFGRAIIRPVREITATAEAIARGDVRPLEPPGRVPAEVHALGVALESMTRQMRERADYVREFAANVSHELKTPLTAVRGAAELLRESWHEMDDAQRARFIENVDADAARMERLVTGLLHLARIEHAAGDTSAEALELRPFFGHLVDRYEGRVRLEVAPGAPAALNIAPEHLESAVGNLLDNAVRHGGDAPVDLRLGDADGRLSVVVRDRGAGISEGNRARVFDRFFTTERDDGGTGLGLAIVAAVARARGGSVDFQTGAGGTTFTLVL